MKKIDFENKITMYINGELNQKDKIDFEKEVDENSNVYDRYARFAEIDNASPTKQDLAILDKEGVTYERIKLNDVFIYIRSYIQGLQRKCYYQHNCDW